MLTRRKLLRVGFAVVGIAALGGCEDKPAEVAAPTLVPTPVPLPTDTHAPTTGNPDLPVVDLALPFDLADLAWQSGEFVSPFGVVRKSQDRVALGHGGIDIPLKLAAPIYAVAAGTVISVEPSVDFRPGDVVVLLLQHGVRPGEAWIFLYEHVTLEPDIAVGTSVARGQLMARNAMPTGVSNNHLELAYAFNEYRFTMSKTCWVHQLETGARTALVELFEKTIRVSDVFVEGWRTATDEGLFPIRALLDLERFPDGPQLCYPPGTDVREP